MRPHLKRALCKIIGHKPKTGYAGCWVTWCERCGEILKSEDTLKAEEQDPNVRTT